ncbi:MAG TPA: hypothetical protein HPP94_15790 [Desulfuromonadales bacterium]|nr:hypothetical protein [Desulfuromonadales bacterium]
MTVFLGSSQSNAGQMVIIGNSTVPKLDVVTVQKIYTGKIITVSGVNIIPVALKPGTMARVRFLREYLKQDEDKYIAYWTVRRYIGQGIPPSELVSANDVIRFVLSTPGAIGYIDEAELKQGVTVVGRRN